MSDGPSAEEFTMLCICMVIGAGLYWLFSMPYRADFFPFMAHGLYVVGMIVLTASIVFMYFKIDENHYLVFTSLWLMVMGLWIMFAYGIYGVINVFLAWWGSSLAFHSGLILMALAMLVLLFWALRELYYKREEEKELG